MTPWVRAIFSLWISFMFAWQCQAGCAEVDSMTEAVVGEDFMLGCISCKRRAEVEGVTVVDWHFKPPGENDSYHIFRYDYPEARTLHEDFESRLDWAGTEGTSDIQIGAVYLRNVSFNDSGTYTCTFHRTLHLPFGDQEVTVQKQVELTVAPTAKRELAAVISEIMMYVLIIGLQLWMIGVLVYCYRKIYAENEAREARKALRDQKKRIDPKDSCDGVHME